MKTVHIFMISMAFLFNGCLAAEEKQTPVTTLSQRQIISVQKVVVYALSSVALSYLNKEEKSFLIYWASNIMGFASVYAAIECLQ